MEIKNSVLILKGDLKMLNYRARTKKNVFIFVEQKS